MLSILTPMLILVIFLPLRLNRPPSVYMTRPARWCRTPFVGWANRTTHATPPCATLYYAPCVIVQNNLWRPTVKDSTTHKDGSVTVHYEVPAGYNERLQLFKRITPAVRPRFPRVTVVHPQIMRLI